MNASPLTTTDATTTTLQAYAPRQVSRYTGITTSLAALDLLVTAQATDGTSAAFFIRGAGKVVDGAVSLVDTPAVTALKDSGASSWAATLDASDGPLRLRVTGASGKTIDWRVERASISSGLRGNADWAA